VVAVSALLVGLAVLLLVPPSGSRRLARATATRDRSSRRPAGLRGGGRRDRGSPGRLTTGGAARPSRLPLPVLACALAGAAVALLLPLPLGLAAGGVVAALGPRVLSRLEPRSVREERERLLADLPLLLDLLSSCLAGGAALPDAARAVGAAVPGPAGRRLESVAAMLAVGAPPRDAWAALSGGASLPGGASGGASEDPLAPAARALARAADGGAPVAAAVARMATEARADARSVAEQAARRVGVLVVMPLGLCFLPAFVLLGVVPVVAGLAGPLLTGM
jgi:Flp pilus assembly protein TadB